jgi:3-ketosteroid 9alpha-monooxygenase subunit A
MEGKPRFPFPRYPNGWFQVAYSDEVTPGTVVPLKYFGADLVLFRTQTGEAHVLDAHCPHVGAHLGHGGCVKGESIQCPFHAWRFDGQGQCVAVPYARKIPPRAKLRAWDVRDINGLIMVHHHAAGEAPSWEVPAVEECTSEEWTPFEKRRWQIRTHSQEIAENAVDTAHFHYLHGTVNLPAATAQADGPVLRAVANNRMTTPAGEVEGTIEVEAYGFGFAKTRFRGLVETLLISSVTTIDDEYVDLRFTFTVKKLGGRSLTRGVGAAFVAEIERQLAQDIPIWENKKYMERPALCDGDGPIGLYRKWCRQFYTFPAESTPRAMTG